MTGLEAQELDLDLALTKKLWKKDSDFLDETRYLLLDYSNAFNRLDIIAEDPSNPYAYDLLGIVALYQMMGELSLFEHAGFVAKWRRSLGNTPLTCQTTASTLPPLYNI